jgi:Holliday junction resolvasome RuvABC endonuclease subunit
LNDQYIWALDLSLARTGVAIFTNDGNCIHTESIETKTDETTQSRLGRIGESIIKLEKTYPPSDVIIEQGFIRFNKSSQQVFRVHGLINYLLRQYNQIYYPATKVKMIVGGKGNIKKEALRDTILMEYPNMKFGSLDESDAFAIGMTYFLENGLLTKTT